MTATRVRNLFLAGCFATALALTWAGAAARRDPVPTPVPTPVAASCPAQQTEPPPSTEPTTAAAATRLDEQPPATVQNLRRADRH